METGGGGGGGGAVNTERELHQESGAVYMSSP